MKIKVLHSETQAEIKELNLAHVIQEGESCFVGRSKNSGLVLDSPGISRLHGEFSHQDGQYYFCDLGSSNGSLIRGEAAAANQSYLLQPGDVIRLGDFVLLLEATPEPPEELAQTIVGNLDATVVSGLTDTAASLPMDIPFVSAPPEPEHAVTPELEPELEQELEQVIEAELVREESSALVRIEPTAADYNLRDQTRALFTAINQRVIAELRAAGNLSRETYLKAIRRARESIEQERLIDPEQFEKEAEKHWQSITKNTSDLGVRIGAAAIKGASGLGNRLGAAAKAAWREFLSHQSAAKQQEPPTAEDKDSSPASQSENIDEFSSPESQSENIDELSPPESQSENVDELSSTDSESNSQDKP